MPYGKLEEALYQDAVRASINGNSNEAASILADRLKAIRGRAWRDTLILKDVSNHSESLILTFRFPNRLGSLDPVTPKEADVTQMILEMARSPLIECLLDTGVSVSFDVDDPHYGARHSFKNFLGNLMRVKGARRPH